jgi:methyl-accepting chemotaxis protein
LRLLHNARLGVKMSLLTGIALLIIAVLGVGGVLSTMAIGAEAQKVIDNDLKPAQAIGDVRAATAAMRAGYMSLQTTSGLVNPDGVHLAVSDQEQKLDKALAILGQNGFTDQKAEELASFQGLLKQYQENRDKLWSSYQAGSQKAFSLVQLVDIDNELQLMEAFMIRLNLASHDDATQAEVSLARNKALATQMGIAGVAVAAVLLVVLAMMISGSLVGPMKKLADLAEQIGAGDLQQVPGEVRRADEVGRLHNSIVQMAQSMRLLLSEVGRSTSAVDQAADSMLINAEEVSRAAGQLAEAIQQVAAGASGQHESVQETALIMEQMREAIEQVTRGAQEQSGHVSQTNYLAGAAGQAVQMMVVRVENLAAASEQARTSAEDGIAIVTKAVASIERLQGRVESSAEMVQALEAESRQISQAVELITDIADQTNLLALNAAIEAARAGESGRGFAVVADEVRKLAERSARSAGEIAQRIQSVERRTSAVSAAMRDSRAEARESSSLASGAGEALRVIADGVRGTVTDMQELREGSEAVAAATKSAVEAVDQIAAVIQESTATTEEMAASSEQMGQAVGAIARTAQESAATAEEVSASVEELSATTEHVTETARQLTEVSAELRKQVERFKV